MIQAEKIVHHLSQHNFGPYICVPCSLLKPFINFIIDDETLTYIKATNEGEAVGISAGACLAGKIPVVMMQNSGLGNAINPITSLTNIYKTPLLFIISLRGEPGQKDEPQHEIMGKITSDLLTLTGIKHSYLPDNEEDIHTAITQASNSIKNTCLPYAFILRKGIVKAHESIHSKNNGLLPSSFTACDTPYTIKDAKNSRFDTIKTILTHLPPHLPIVSTTGMISRELYTLADKSNHFYMVGSMGLASALSFGICLVKKTTLVILDGDGACLMKMGNVATIGHYAPPNLIHIVLDNRSYDSTGGQDTASSTVNMPGIAISCGYKTAASVSCGSSLPLAIKKSISTAGPHFIHILVKKGHSKGLGRPAITPLEQKERFFDYLGSIE